MINNIILTVTKRIPAVVPHLRGRAGLVYCEHKSMARDRREPLLDRKEADENKLRLAIMRRFRRQLAGVESDIRRNKSVIANGVFVPDNGDEVTEMVRLMYNAILAGVAYNEIEIGFALGDGSINQPALEYAKTYVTKWLSELDEVSSKAVRDALGLFISQPGANLGDVMSVLQAGGFSEQRAQRIAVTEITRVYAEANQIYANALAAQYPEFKIKKRYFTNVDDRVCPVCAPLDGKVADYDDEFAIPNPPLHVNCILPGNEVVAPDLVAASKSFYVGRCVEITLADGRKLSITKNHPILTARGWVAAEFVNHTDNVIITTNPQRIVSSMNPNYQYRPTPIEQVFSSLMMSRGVGTRSVKVTPVDFHGDGRGIHGDVNVVRMHGFLRSYIDAPIPQPLSQLNFNGGSVNSFLFNRQGAFDTLKHRSLAALSSLVGGGGLPFPLGGRHTGPLQRLGLALIAWGNSRSQKTAAESPSINPRLAGEFVFRFSSDIAFQQVVNIRHFDFSGHVYDLQCDMYELYTCNGVIVKNCRCWTAVTVKA